MDDYPFISEIDGVPYLEPENYDREPISLKEIFELYSKPETDPGEVARMLGVDKSDIGNAVFYWTEETDVYMDLAADSETENTASPDSSSHTSSSNSPPPQASLDVLDELSRRYGTYISREDIIQDKQESVFGTADEVYVEWERNGSDLGLYVGQTDDEVLISYSVDGEMGEVLQVEEDQTEGSIQEMYRNAVFGSEA